MRHTTSDKFLIHERSIFQKHIRQCALKAVGAFSVCLQTDRLMEYEFAIEDRRFRTKRLCRRIAMRDFRSIDADIADFHTVIENDGVAIIHPTHCMEFSCVRPQDQCRQNRRPI